MSVKTDKHDNTEKTVFERYKKNPILRPNKDNWWESKEVFNPGVLYDGNNVHMLYRAIGDHKQCISRFGYACSTDGFSFERKNEIAFEPREGYEKYGIEDLTNDA